ncbi:MAG: DUF6320 domain-containing protein [Christensenellaceae bacterium]|jgi:hypothetical protein|nr:DUF6320 domain-containing protein [Christensenellaceae bacterium]
MQCPECKIEIGCRTRVCPLCHASLEEEYNNSPRLPRYFPQRGRIPLLGTSLFDRVYLIIAITIAAVMLTVFLLIGMFRFFWVTLAALLYLYFLIRNTIKGTDHFTHKVVLQTIVLTCISFTLPPAFTRPLVIYEYILPALYLVAIIMLGIFTLANYKMFSRHLINLVFVAILGLFPLIIIMLSSSEGRPNFIFAMVTASLAAMIIIIALASSSKRIVSELKRLFHV